MLTPAPIFIALQGSARQGLPYGVSLRLRPLTGFGTGFRHMRGDAGGGSLVNQKRSVFGFWPLLSRYSVMRMYLFCCAINAFSAFFIGFRVWCKSLSPYARNPLIYKDFGGFRKELKDTLQNMSIDSRLIVHVFRCFR